MGVESLVKEKSFEFAVCVMNLHGKLPHELNARILGKKLVRNGTAIGAHIMDAKHLEGTDGFVRKFMDAQAICGKCLYWLELLHTAGYVADEDYDYAYRKADDLYKSLHGLIAVLSNKRFY